MRYSDIALKILAAKECGIIKSNAQFWRYFYERDKIEEILIDDRVLKKAEELSNKFGLSDSEEGFVCVYDDDFPVINRKVKNNGDKPYLLFYNGDLSLLGNLNNNVAVIGLIDPDEEIVKRESKIVKRLVENNLIIVSGLAKGCDTVAHKVCLESNGKTIAILPSQLSKIYPAENRELAEEIVNKGGLLITEYYKDPVSRYESINRFIERDRLQAMFSKAIILIASYRKGEGDSGSRHALEAAKMYGIERYAMYNSEIDEQNKRFGLNKDLVNGEEQVKILVTSSINQIKDLENPNLSPNLKNIDGDQLNLW